jgi:DNA repair exonuclease SbcCD ATPase subunit
VRLLELHLQAFGAFSDTTLRFAEDGAKLHVVYGKNEAGKSTALRAIKALFYGVPTGTPDGHFHRLDKLRIGARLRDRQGRALEVVRRKGTKNTLLAPDGTPLPASEEAWLTAGVIEPQYDALFGLSYDTLSEKALETLGGAGGLGESLLGASLGGRSVHATLKALRDEADALYRPRGRNQKINELLSALEDEKRRVRSEAQHAETFTQQELAILESEAAVERLREHRQALGTERERLDRARRVLPLLGQRAELLRERTDLGEVRLLSADAAEQRVRLEETLRGEARRMQELSAEIQALEAGRHGPGTSSEQPLDPALARQVREQAARQGVLIGELAKKDKALSLRDQELAQANERGRAHFGALSRVEGVELPLFAQLALPSRDMVSGFEQRLSACETALGAVREREREQRAELERVSRDLTDLVGASALPSEAELLSLRQTRGQTLARLRGLLAEPSSVPRAFAAGGEGEALLAQLDLQMERADMAGDRLRQEAARVERHARLAQEQAHLDARLRDLALEHGRLRDALAETQREWSALWRSAGVQPAAPRVMQAWLQQQR